MSFVIAIALIALISLVGKAIFSVILENTYAGHYRIVSYITDYREVRYAVQMQLCGVYWTVDRGYRSMEGAKNAAQKRAQKAIYPECQPPVYLGKLP